MEQSNDPAQEAENRAVIARAFDAWRDRTGSPFDILAEHARWTIPGHSVVAGSYTPKAVFIEKVIAPFNARMNVPLAVTNIRQIFAEGDTVIAFFDGAGEARDGVRYENTYVWIMRLENCQIVDVTAFFDSIAFDALWNRVTPASM
jgi:uncharacterized protein